ncbi:MAG: hypothetical protein ACRBFS_22930 [Aureispira sp.]
MNEHIQLLIDAWGENAVYLRAKTRRMFFMNSRHGKFSLSTSMWNKFTLSSQVKGVESSAKISDTEFSFNDENKKNRRNLREIEGEGTNNTVHYATDYTVTYANGEIKCEIFSGLSYMVALEYMYESMNEPVLRLAKEALGDDAPDHLLAKYMATSTLTYEYDLPEFDKLRFNVDVAVTPRPEGGVTISGTLLKDGQPLESDDPIPTSYYVSIEPSEGIIGVPNSVKAAGEQFETAGGTDLEFILDTDTNNDKAWLIYNSKGVKLRIFPKWVEQKDNDVVRGITEVDLPELEDMLPTYDYFGLGAPMDLTVDLFVYQQYSGSGGQRLQTSRLNGELMYPPPFDQHYANLEWEWSKNGVKVSTKEHVKMRDFASGYNGIQLITGKCTDTNTGEVYTYEEWGIMVHPDLPMISEETRWNPKGLEVPKTNEIES